MAVNSSVPWPTFVNAKLSVDYKDDLIRLLKEYVDCFAWEYSEMPSLSRHLVEHQLPIMAGLDLINNLICVLILLCMTK